MRCCQYANVEYHPDVSDQFSDMDVACPKCLPGSGNAVGHRGRHNEGKSAAIYAKMEDTALHGHQLRASLDIDTVTDRSNLAWQVWIIFPEINQRNTRSADVVYNLSLGAFYLTIRVSLCGPIAD